jgi:hypothetical protein
MVGFVRRVAGNRHGDCGIVRRGRALAFAALVLLFGGALAACGEPTSDGTAAEATTTTTKPLNAWDNIAGLGTGPSVPPVDTEAPISAGVLVAGAVDARILWSFWAEGIESMAVHDGVVYVTTDTEVVAASLADGTVLWRHFSADDYFSDYGSRVGIDGDELWVVAPYNTNIHLDPATGRTTRVVALADSEYPEGFTPLPTPTPTEWAVTNTDDGAQAVLPDGRTAWQLDLGEYDTGYGTDGPVVADGSTTLVAAADGVVYAVSAS